MRKRRNYSESIRGIVSGKLESEERAFIGIGANIGDRETAIAVACDRLCRLLDDFMLSSVYETKAVEYLDQPDFLNAVASGRPSLPPEELLAALHTIESDLGRSRGSVPRFGPRSIDLDLLLYGSRTIVSTRLQVPHPRMYKRKFVLIPLLEIDQELQDPISHQKFLEILQDLEPQGVYYFTLNLYS